MLLSSTTYTDHILDFLQHKVFEEETNLDRSPFKWKEGVLKFSVDINYEMIGIIVAAVVVFLIFVTCCIFFLRRRRKQGKVVMLWTNFDKSGRWNEIVYDNLWISTFDFHIWFVISIP